MRMKKRLLNYLYPYLFRLYKNYRQKNNDTSLKHCLEVAEDMLHKAKYGFLISHGADGWCSSRLIQPFRDKKNALQFSFWFGTGKDLRKTEELWSNPKVTLAFENAREGANLVIYGNAVIETDPEIKKYYWKSLLQLFFPDGPLSDDYAVIRIEPQRIEMVNFKHNIIPEPFGLKSAVLINHQNQWQMEQT